MINFDLNYKYSLYEIFVKMAPFSFTIIMVIIIIYRIIFAQFVYKSAKSKSVNNEKLWGIISFFLGLVGIVIFLFYNNKKYDVYSKKLLLSKWMISFGACIVLCLFLIPLHNYEVEEWEYNSNETKCSKVVFKNENGDNVFYDKVGNEYLVSNSKFDYDGIDYNFKYYSENGDIYFYDYDLTDSNDEPKYLCNETGDIIFSDNAYINSDGYLTEQNYDTLTEHEICDDPYKAVYLCGDDLYYNPYDCSWDSDGNLVFKNDLLNEFTYNQM